uniref:C2H2-type domain-containing protein n=1 Tax=Trichogramma kaykai TaxID=54128 RepID=A0ABD2WEB4_9HYME
MCRKGFAQVRTLLTHITEYHYIPTSSIAPECPNQSKKRKYETFSTNWSKLNFDSHVTNMVANLRLNTTITATNIGFVTDAVQKLLGNVMNEVEEKIKDFVNEFNVKVSDDHLENFLNQFHCDSKDFSYVKSMRSQVNAIKKMYDYIEPTETFMGRKNTDDGGSKDEDTPLLKHITIPYVSIIEIIKLVFSKDEIANFNKNKRISQENDLLTRFEDGEIFQEHPFFQKYIDAIAFVLYYDEFLVNNPIGTKARKQKLGVFYISFLNLPDHIRDYIGNVHILAIAKHEDIVKYGIDRCLSGFIVDLMQLESDKDELIDGKAFLMLNDKILKNMGIGKMGEIIKVMKIIDDTNNLEVIHLPSESNQFTEEITKNHGNSTTDKQSNVMTEDTDNTDTETKNSTQNKLSKDKISITTEDDTTQNVSHDKENTNNENVSHDKENTNNENVSECSRKRRQPKAIIQHQIQSIVIDFDTWLKPLNITVGNEIFPILKYLELKLPVPCNVNNKIVNQICDTLIDIWNNKYPPTVLYDNIAQKLVEKFPALGTGSSQKDWEKWTKMIENRMKTIRRHNKTEGKYKKRKPSDLSDVDINPDKLLQLKVLQLTKLPGIEENKKVICSLMSDTRKLRITNEANLTPAARLSVYPHLLSYKGEMIHDDYRFMYPEGLENIETHFSTLVDNIVSISENVQEWTLLKSISDSE